MPDSCWCCLGGSKLLQCDGHHWRLDRSQVLFIGSLVSKLLTWRANCSLASKLLTWRANCSLGEQIAQGICFRYFFFKKSFFSEHVARSPHITVWLSSENRGFLPSTQRNQQKWKKATTTPRRRSTEARPWRNKRHRRFFKASAVGWNPKVPRWLQEWLLWKFGTTFACLDKSLQDFLFEKSRQCLRASGSSRNVDVQNLDYWLLVGGGGATCVVFHKSPADEKLWVKSESQSFWGRGFEFGAQQ